MGNSISTKETLITTNEGLRLVRRERTVKMPNGNLRHPVDYYDATPGAVEITPDERERIRIPVYKMLIQYAMLMTDGYPFIFQMNDRAGHDEVLEYTLQYRK